MTENKELINFNFENHQIRAIKDEAGEPWFVAKDVCDVLEHSNPSKALQGLDEDEKGITKSYTLGGAQDMATINESGLYTLILRSNKPQAKPFRKKVTSEILPAIRKTGSYSTGNDSQPKTLTQIAREYKALKSIAVTSGLKGNMAVMAANQAVRKMKGVDCLEMINQTHLLSPNQELCFTPTEIGEQLDMSAQRVNKLLQDTGYQEKTSDKWRATEKGKQHSVLMDTGKKYSNGTPVQQLKWYESIIPILQAFLNESGGQAA